jgi:hypothetical protein
MKHCWQTVNISDTNYTPVLAPTTHCDRLAVVSGVTANMQRTQSTGRGSGQNRLLVVAGVLATSNYSPAPVLYDPARNSRRRARG